MTLRDLFTTGEILEIELADLAPIADLLLAAVLGVIAAGVALLQWTTHQRRVNSEERDRRVQRQYDLFDRRWKIYTGVTEFLDGMGPTKASSVAGVKAARMLQRDSSPRTTDETVVTLVLAQQELCRLMPAAHFLYGRDINEYLEELNTHCNALLAAEREQRAGGALPPAWDEESLWFSIQEIVVKQKFEDYLKLPE